MRYALVLTAAAILAPASAVAAEPPITFQTPPFERLLGDLRAAADLMGGEKAVKALNDSFKDKLGPKGFEGLDLNKPIVGYVLLAPKAEDIVAVIAFPITGEKAFLSLCERINTGPKPKDLGKGLYEVPPFFPDLKARMRFADGYAYVATGKKPEPALDAKAIVPVNKLYEPAENAAFTGKLHFDRLTPEVKAALITLLLDAKKSLLENAEGNLPNADALKPVFTELEKLARRYLLLLGGADTAALRLNFNPGSGDLAVEATLTPKPGTELAKQIAARKPAQNQFAGLLTPDTVAGVYYSAPLFAEEIRNAYAALLEVQQKETAQSLPDAGKGTIEELFKGQARSMKAGNMDIFAAVHGPDKNGLFSGVVAMSFDDSTKLEKEFKKFMEASGPPGEFGTFKWNADKAGKVNIHTFTPAAELLAIASKIFGDDCKLAFAFAPKAIYVTIGPDAIATLKGALKAKPVVAPAFDLVVNPAKLAQLVDKAGGPGLTIENALGKEKKLLSATSLRVTSGKDLRIRFSVNMKVLPRAIFMSTVGAVRKD
jgi:hypothetical protein